MASQNSIDLARDAEIVALKTVVMALLTHEIKRGGKPDWFPAL